MSDGFTIVTYVNPSTLGQTPQSGNAPTPPILKFLKGHPKALGTVQIMIGVMTILCGIVLVFQQYPPIGVISGVVYWGPIISIISGTLSVAAEPNVHPCLVKGSLGMNVVNSLSSGTAIIIFGIDCIAQPMCPDCYWQGPVVTSGIVGVLAVLSLLQFSISISLSAFACKATCCSEQTVPVMTFAHPAHLNPQNLSGVINIPPAGGPPDYSKSESQPACTEIYVEDRH